MQKAIIYMGWDSREPVTYDVARHSILTRTSTITSIIPLELESKSLKNILTRPIEKLRTGENLDVEQLWCPISKAPMSTEFAISRFAIPFLRQTGWALFIDSDIICLTDIAELLALADEKYAVMVVKNYYHPVDQLHDAGMLQTNYPRKNWSSVVLWNLNHPSNKKLTLEMLNTLPGRELHAFCWLADDEIGDLPQEWNYLVGENAPADLRQQKIVHYTNGQPGWKNWVPQESDYLFNEELEQLKKDKSTYYKDYLQRVQDKIGE